MTNRSRLMRTTLLVVAALGSVAGTLAAHDLFLKLDSYFLLKDTAVRVPVLNGTFSKSESVVARDRIAELRLTGPAGSASLDTAALAARNDTSYISFRTGSDGTYVLGLSVLPRDVDYTGQEFNEYLKAEGYEDVLAERLRSGNRESGKRRYATHVKAVFQVGAALTETHSIVLGYPAEIVPMENPYSLKRGASLRIRCLVDGKPMGGLVVHAGGRGPGGLAMKERHITTDANGIARIPLTSAGRWYVKFANMRPSSVGGLNYESQRATLTFGVR